MLDRERQTSTFRRVPILIPFLERGGQGDDLVEHLFQGTQVAVLGGDTTCPVIDGSVDPAPVQLPARVSSHPVPEHALDPAVALPERVDVVELILVVGQALDKPLPGHTSEMVVGTQLRSDVGGGAFDHGHR